MISVSQLQVVVGTVLCVSLASVFTDVQGYLRSGDIMRWAAPARRSWCVVAEGRCYTTGQCCDGYVCAAFSDVYGKNPEIPGYCVKQKELRTCTSNEECGGRFVCAELPHSFENYCVPGHTHPMASSATGGAEEENEISAIRHRLTKPKIQNGLGQPCVDNTECAEMSHDGERMCCQEIRRYRQKPKRICDAIRPISKCIPHSMHAHPGK